MSNLYSLEGFRAPFYNPVHLWLGNLLHRKTDTFVAETRHLVNYSMLSTSSVMSSCLITFSKDYFNQFRTTDAEYYWIQLVIQMLGRRQASISKWNRASIATEKQTDPVLIDYESRWPLARSSVYKTLYITGNEAWVVESRRLQDLPPKWGFLFANSLFSGTWKRIFNTLWLYKTLKISTFPLTQTGLQVSPCKYIHIKIKKSNFKW